MTGFTDDVGMMIGIKLARLIETPDHEMHTALRRKSWCDGCVMISTGYTGGRRLCAGRFNI